MATIIKNGVVLINGLDASCYLTSINESADVDLKDATPLCTTGYKSYVPGQADYKLQAEGFHNWSGTDEAQNIRGLFLNAVGNASGVKVSIGSTGSAIVSGSPASIYTADVSKAGNPTKISDLMMISFDASGGKKSAGALAYQSGVWLMNETVTTLTNGVSYDNALAGVGYLFRVHNTSSVGSVTVKIQHSTNNSTWVDLDTVTVAANSVSEVYSTSATANRYVRAVATPAGASAKVGAVYVHNFTGN